MIMVKLPRVAYFYQEMQRFISITAVSTWSYYEIITSEACKYADSLVQFLLIYATTRAA